MADVEHAQSTAYPECVETILNPLHLRGMTQCARCCVLVKPPQLAYWWQERHYCMECITGAAWPSSVIRGLCQDVACRLCGDAHGALELSDA